LQFFNKIGLADSPLISDVSGFGFSLFNTCAIVAALAGIAFSKPLARRFGKRDTFIFGLMTTAVLQGMFIFYGPSDLWMMYGTYFILSFFYGITTPLLWAMIGDVADFSEWKTNRRATGLVFSAVIFGLKAGLSLGGAVAGYMLSFYGYDSELMEQSATALLGIKLSVSIYTAIAFFLGAVLLFIYEIDKKTEFQIQMGLEERRKLKN
jgi:GPH family glycoside/pentoside/hexuronide:cation symporter